MVSIPYWLGSKLRDRLVLYEYGKRDLSSLGLPVVNVDPHYNIIWRTPSAIVPFKIGDREYIIYGAKCGTLLIFTVPDLIPVASHRLLIRSFRANRAEKSLRLNEIWCALEPVNIAVNEKERLIVISATPSLSLPHPDGAGSVAGISSMYHPRIVILKFNEC
jgi:hypothetical protein